MPADASRPRATPSTRRDFLLRTTSAAVAGALGTRLAALPGAHAAGRDELRLGLIGCGGRGNGAAVQALRADPSVRLVAVADAFQDRIERALPAIRQELGEAAAEKVRVEPERCYTGFDGGARLLESGVDAVVLAAPPHFRPAHLEAAVRAGVHVFAEKPVAVDAPGVRRVLAACAEARRKKLSIVSGLCWRYDDGMRATFARLHDGAVGRITALQCTYDIGALWHRGREPAWSDMEWQVRNWLYFTWLSGDHIVEQHIHSLDKMSWAMQNRYPVRAQGVGGRQVRTDPKYGNVFDHFAVVYEFDDGVKCFSQCRQQQGCDVDVSDHVFGADGTCDVFAHRITGARPWQFEGESREKYQAEQDAFIASVRAGTSIDDGDMMAHSTLMAILGRMAAYTGKTVTWEQALASTEDLTPASYAWGPLPVADVAQPGVTKLV